MLVTSMGPIGMELASTRVSEKLRTAERTQTDVDLTNDSLQSSSEIATKMNEILDKFLNEPEFSTKGNASWSITLVNLFKNVRIFYKNSAMFAKIRNAGAFRVIPRVFQQRVFYLRQSTDVQKQKIDSWVNHTLRENPSLAEFEATIEKIHRICEKSFPEHSAPDQKSIELAAKAFQRKFGFAFRDTFSSQLEKMKATQDFHQLDHWLQKIKYLHKTLDSLDADLKSLER